MTAIKPSPELAAIVRRWLRAYATNDKETVVNLFSGDAALGYIGSSDDEIWRGDTLRLGIPEYMDDIPRFSWDHEDFRGFECGHLGWVNWICEKVTADNGKSFSFRSTFILHLEKGTWKVVHVHNSNPVSNKVALGYEPRGFEDLLDAALTSPVELPRTGISSIMFTDIADSTVIAETIGDARWSGAIHAHVQTVSALITKNGGTLLKTLGDGTMSSFTSARAALTAAIALQEAMANSSSEPRLQIRIGLHTGDLVEQDGDMFGNVVNKAARIAALAEPGSILLSDATRIMVGGTEFTFADTLTTPLKGLEGEHVVHRLEWKD